MNPQTNNNIQGLSDLTFDLVTILENKAKALRAYEQYVKDAEKEGSAECAELLKRVAADDQRHVEELKAHVATLLGGLSRGAQGQQNQQGQRSAQGSQQTER